MRRIAKKLKAGLRGEKTNGNTELIEDWEERKT
jgi:hypothetical protein